MASTPEGRRLTEGHRRAQLRVGAETVRAMEQLWRVLAPESREPRVQDWIDAVLLVLGRQYDVSAAIARDYYTTFRLQDITEAGMRYVVPLADWPKLDTNKATAALIVNGPAEVAKNLRRGLPIDEASRRAQVKAARDAMRIALNGGRDQVLNAVEGDRRAIGWARVSDGAPCAFCALLLSRGPVYKREGTADFKAHSSCGCSAEPVFSRDTEWPPGAREANELYKAATRGESDKLNAFRRAYESQVSAPAE